MTAYPTGVGPSLGKALWRTGGRLQDIRPEYGYMAIARDNRNDARVAA